MEALHDPRIKRILLSIRDSCPASYIVGGAVRDHLMGRHGDKDLDVAVNDDGIDLAKRIADSLGAEFAVVPLDAEHGTARIVVRAEPYGYVDISRFKAATIEEDLALRDFTINALALKVSDLLESRNHNVIDVAGGQSDIRARTVRVCSRNAFADDPLRILRAFRFMARLGFDIAAETLTLIPENVEGLKSVATERVRDELIAILESDSSFPALMKMDEASLFAVVFPELTPMKGCEQNDFHHLDVWFHSLEAVRQMELILETLSSDFGETGEKIRAYVTGEIVPRRQRLALLKLAALFHDSGKPAARFIDAGGRVRFFGHEKISRRIFEESASRLKLSNKEIKSMADIVDGHMRPTMFTARKVSAKAINRLFRRFEKDVVGLLILFLSDLAATQGPARRPGELERAKERVAEALRTLFQTENQPRKKLVSGRDLIAIFQMESGPRLGKLLNRLSELQDLQEIGTREEALAAARKLLAAHYGE